MQVITDNDKKQKRILVIEDEDYLRDCICDFLKLAGFSPIQAANGREGMEMFGRYAPDLIITDIRMPEMTGHDILKFIQIYSANTPVIVISGTDSLSDVAKCLKLGAWDYIIKPVYDYGVVEISILRALERKQLIEENKRYKDYLEEEVLKRSDELLSYMARFKTLFNLAGDVLLIHDQDGKIIDCNEMAFKQFGCDRGQLLEMNMRDLIVEEDISLFNQIMVRLPQKNSIIFDLRFLQHDGDAIAMELHATMIAADASCLVFVICRDITERQRTELERSELKKQIAAAQRMELVGLLTSGIAHDFNNVLSALLGYSSLLQTNLSKNGGDEDEGHAVVYADKIANIAEKGRALTGRLMSFIRKKREELVQVDVHKAILETESMLRPNCKRVKINIELGAKNCIVLGDESQLQSAFLSLGLNSYDAMPDGGEISFRTFNEDKYQGSERKGCGFIRIDVIDTGTGIDENTIKKIFEPLFTTKDSTQGTGLGLPGVLYSIKNFHGYIDVESETDKGTTFKITLPLYDPALHENIDLSGKQTLIVTDNPEVTDLMNAKFARYGIRTKFYNDPESALEWLKENADSAAVIIADLDQPYFDENEFADKAAAIAPNVLIVKILSKDLISIGSNKNYVAFNNTPIKSERFFEALTMYISDRVINEKKEHAL
ncbi:MAG: response regulator [Chitinispirillales bacterium]|nr:response regulator [Chitinispirillales bacterium]